MLKRFILLILTLMISLSFVCCGGGGGGGGGGSSYKNSPVTTIAGPDGSTITTPEGGLNGDATIELTESAASSGLVEAGETIVSTVLAITTSSDEALMGDGTFSLSIPVDSTKITEPDKLELKVMLSSSGISYPLYGVYDSSLGLFNVEVSGIMNGWEIAVVEDPEIEIIQVSSDTGSSVTGSMLLAAWLTDLDWKTYEWSVVNHTNMTEADIKEKILPVLWDASKKLSDAGLRSPKIYIDPRLSPQGRVVHLIGGVGPNDGGSHFTAGAITYADGSWTYVEDQASFSTILLDDDQLSALGQLYINYDQYESLNQQYGVSLGNIVIHELYHAVQAGYDVRKKQKSLAAYLEGTATPLGQTYQDTGGSVTGPSISVRVLRPNEHARLYQPVDDPKAPLQYTKQDFFAYVAKRYGGNSFAWTDQLFEYMNTWTSNKFDLTADEYRELYRKATNDAFSTLFKKGLSAIFKEYALDRAYEHSGYAILRSAEETEKNGFGANHLAKTLFQWNNTDTNGLKELDTETSPLIEFPKIEPLSCYAFYMRVPDQDDSETSEGFPLVFKVDGGEVSSSAENGIKIVAFLEDAYEDKVPDGKIDITDVSKAVMIPFKEDAVYLTVLIMNCYLEDKNVKVTVAAGPYISSVSPNPAVPGDDITVTGLSFGASQGTSTLYFDGEEVSDITYWSDTAIEFPLPEDAETGKVKVSVNAVSSNEVELEVEEQETEARSFSFVQTWSKSHWPSGWDPEAATIDFTASVTGEVLNAINPQISIGDFNVDNAKIVNVSNMKTSEVVTVKGTISMTLSKTTISPEAPRSKCVYTYSNPKISRYEDGVYKETYPGLDFSWVVTSNGIYNDSDFYVEYKLDEKEYTREDESSSFTLLRTKTWDKSQEFHLEINVDKDVPYYGTP